MAQQLAATRSPASYSGVAAYAASHSGDASAAANLALGHAYLMDHRYPEAIAALRLASARSQLLADYADYLQAQADVQAGHPQDAVPLLVAFADRYPGSLFVPNVPVLLANTYLAENDAADALRVLTPLRSGPAASHVDFRYALAKSYQAAGNTAQAAGIYREIYLGEPLSFEATQAKSQMEAMGTPPTSAERKQHADGLFNAKQYAQAGAEYRSLQKTGHDLSQADRDFLDIYAAVCDLKLKKLTRGDVSGLPVTGDDSAALKIYLQSELARNEGKTDEQQALTQQLLSRYPQSRWLEEALYSGGNMFLLKKDLPRAVEDYTTLVQSFPRSAYAPNAHWHAAWLNYRLRRYPEAARLMDEQIVSYPAGSEIPGALYWRGRLYEDQEHNFGQAVNYYKAVNAAYANSYYAILARERLAVLGTREAAAPSAVLASVRTVEDPHLTDALPENDPHLLKARLLANAGLNEYIRPEIQLSATSAQWGTLAEAEIYQSFGEDTRALQAMKRSKIPFFSLPVAAVPMAYWRLVFPRPYWDELNSDAQAHGLDPNLVAALIRQESEFNPGAVSRANAYGLMQLLPSTGKSMAKQEGEHRFTTAELLDPVTNLRLGTLDLRKSIDRYGGQMEYALAAYNAGDVPVRQWIAMNDYKDIPEWVESIPYTETRDYVQGILRNREMYRAIYAGR
jgi:soluble lytic murein transglycosylase